MISQSDRDHIRAAWAYMRKYRKSHDRIWLQHFRACIVEIEADRDIIAFLDGTIRKRGDDADLI